MSEVKAAIRTLRLFEAFALRKEPLSLSELSQQLNLPVSSCLGLVRTLLRRGYLYETARRGGYYPTRRMHDYATEIMRHDPVADRVLPVLTRLRDETTETVVLAKIQNDRAIYLDIVESLHVIRPSIVPGTLRPLHATATGKALLAELDEKTRQQMLRRGGMERLTQQTITAPKELEVHLKKGKARGWHDNKGEGVSDLHAISKAVTIHNELYAVSVMGPVNRMQYNGRRHVNALLAACGEIQRAGAPIPLPRERFKKVS